MGLETPPRPGATSPQGPNPGLPTPHGDPVAKHHSKRDRAPRAAPTRGQGRQSKSTSDVAGYRWACGACIKNPLGGFSHRRFHTNGAAMDAGKLHKQRHHLRNAKDVLIMVAPENHKASVNHKIGAGPFVGHCGGCEFHTDPTSDYNEADDLAEEHRWGAHADEPDIRTNVAETSL